MTQLILIRHGETDWNRALRFQGHTDVPLNDLGQEQARRLGNKLMGVRSQFLYCSDLLRAKQTAIPVQAALSLEPIYESQLREQFFGAVESMSVSEIKAKYPAEWNEWIKFDADYAMPDGETTRQFYDRIVAAMSAIVARHTDDTVAVVTHGGVLDMVYRSAMSLGLGGPRQSAIPNAGVNKVSASLVDGVAKFTIEEWAITDHLENMPSQPVYDQTQLSKALIR